MGKYKQWLHHQEIGRRLRDQTNTLELERARVQKMAPANPTSLPDLENPIITSLLAYTRAGNKLSNIDVIKAAMPKIDPALEQRRPAPNGSAAPAAQAQSVVAGLQARAASIPAGPLEQMRDLSRNAPAASPATAQSGGSKQPQGAPASSGQAGQGAQAGKAGSKPDSVGGWWQRQRSED